MVLDLRNNGRTAVVENACLACATGFLARLRDSLRSGREAELEKALRDVLAVCRDRQAFAMMVMIDRTSRPTRLFVSKRQEILCEMLRRSAAEVELKSIRF